MSILKSLKKLNLLNVGLTVIIFMFIINKVSGMTNMPALPSEIQHDFEDAYDMYEMITTEATDVNATAENKTDKPIVGNYWMMKMGEIKEDLLRVQAVVVKDEDAEAACSEGKLKTRHRFLMCAGSILHRNRVLTTASCLHEAMHIKHNIRAPLAVVIAPMKSSIQIIRVAEYKIHPSHNTNPYSADHMKHNIAILSLACRISKVNYYKINLPTEPMTHICTEENCVLAVFRKTKHEIVISQIQAPQIPLNDRRRRSINVTNESLNINNISSLITNNNYNDMKKLAKRSADGTKGCAQTGAAVMVNRTQTAIVAISCDDRQEDGKWFYTDLFHNNDWINEVLNDWNRSHATKPPLNNGVTGSPSNDNSTNARGCGNCIFNFYISVGCKEKGNCPKGSRVMTNVPTVNHNVRQVTNSDFIDNWSNAKRDPTTWNKQAVSDDNILKFSQELADKCPDNSPECSESAEINNRNYNKPIYRNGDLPIVIRTYNQSVISGNGRFYHNNDGFKRSGNHSWVLRKFKRIPKQNLFALRNSASKKHVRGEMGNWLRRRHVSSSVKNNEKVKNNKRSGS